MKAHAVALQSISFRYSRDAAFALRIGELDIAPGTLLFLSGRSGCGKTTLLNVLAGIHNTAITDAVRRAFGSVAYVMHASTLFPWLTVERALHVEQSLREGKVDRELFKELITEFGLETSVLQKRGPELSLGMRQRVEVARALSVRPDLLLLDEAISGIDPTCKRAVMRRIVRAAKEDGVAIIGTAHQAADMLRLADRICFMEDGKLIRCETLESAISERIDMSTSEVLKSFPTKVWID